MRLTDSFTLPVAADRLWDVLTDIELVAPSVPGFQLEEAVDPEYHGLMKIKVGAVSVTYDATIRFEARDDEQRRAVISVTGKEKRGPGGVSATVVATLTEHGDQTTAEMVTDVEVTGKVAQFGRGIVADVGSRITRQFIDDLNARVLAPPASERPDERAVRSDAANANGAPTPPPAEALDLGATAAVPVLKRALPAAAAMVLLVLMLRRRRTQRRWTQV